MITFCPNLFVLPKESDEKTYLMPELEQRRLKQAVGKKEFINYLRDISFQVLFHNHLACDISNIQSICTNKGIRIGWEFKEI